MNLFKIPNNKYVDENEVWLKDESIPIDLSKPIFVYKNLNKNCYSIKQDNKVIAYGNRLCLSNAEFIVREAGRNLVLKTKQKNVHAFVKGFYCTSGMGTDAKHADLPCKIRYNPYEFPYFYNINHKNKRLKGARFVILKENGIFGAYTF